MFMAFPLNGKPDWRRPPWVTILLIVVNCIVYFGPQLADQRRAERAAQAYQASRLPRIELPRYADFLAQRDQRGDAAMAERIRAALAHGEAAGPGAAMERDRGFMAALRAGRIIEPENPDYAVWRKERMQLDELRGQRFTERWASNPSDWDPATLLTSMFLHGSLMHLIGNMVFLFAFGYTVEMSMGPLVFIACYLLAGMAGDVGDLTARWGDPSIGLGASGAISGLMAIYAILYGMRKIKFFFQFLFYFDYVTAPAIILLPFWIIDQVWLQLTSANQGVAYMAHVGGLLGGTVLGAYYKRRHKGETIVLPEAPPPDPFPEALARAEGLVKAMKVAQARDAFAALVAMRPHDAVLLSRYANLARLAPADEHFHRAAAQVFAQRGSDPATMELIADTLRHYLDLARPHPRLSADQMSRLSLLMARAGQAPLAERVAATLLKLSPQHPQVPSVVYSLARMHHQHGNAERSGHWVRTLREQYPQCPEARLPI
jgi:membrane associated rhomboid family serine protease